MASPAILLVADRVVTLGRGRLEAGSVLVRGSRIVWVGDDPGQAPPHDAAMDLSGSTLGPAFVDAHVHLTPTGMALVGLDLSDVSSGQELLDRIRSHAHGDPGRVVWGLGYDDHGFPDPLPTADDLADAAPGRVVYLSRTDGHSCLVDRATLSAAPLARADGVERDADGGPTGVLKREAHHVVRMWAIGALSDDELAAARTAAARRAASLGIASVHEMGGPDIMGSGDFDAWISGSWPVEVVGYWGAMDLDFVLERGLRQVGGDLSLDGSLGSRTAALTEPYADHGESGHLYVDDGELTAFFREATIRGLQVGAHAIGDAAVSQAVRCWREVARGLPEYLNGEIRRLRHRIEHAELIPPELLTEIADLGLVASVQPAFEERWGKPGGMYTTRLGEGRAGHMNPFRTLADLGVPLAFGSDSNVTPMDPWGGIWAAQRRWRSEHALSRLEAVSASVVGGRHAARQDRFVGTVRAGMRADLAAYEGDPYAADDPRGATCVLTLLKGRVTHGDAPLPTWEDGERRREKQRHVT
jgi:predicted amidohydrolase YtcJ